MQACVHVHSIDPYLTMIDCKVKGRSGAAIEMYIPPWRSLHLHFNEVLEASKTKSINVLQSEDAACHHALREKSMPWA